MTGDHLGEFLRSASGPWNCSTMPADWCLALGHPDFAAPWRGITDISACAEVSAAAGGLVELWRDGIGDGLPIVDPPYQPGDIGVVVAHGVEAGAICTGDKWAMRTARGVIFWRAPDEAIVQAWRP